MKNNTKRIGVVYLIPALLILSSCVGSITNNIEKIEGKVDSNITAEAKVNTNVDTKIDTNLKVGDIKTNLSTNYRPIKKAIKFLYVESYRNSSWNIGDKIKPSIEVIYEDGTSDNDISYLSSNSNALIVNSDGTFLSLSSIVSVNVILTANKDKNLKDALSISIMEISREIPKTPNPNMTATAKPIPTAIFTIAPTNNPTPTIANSVIPVDTNPTATPTATNPPSGGGGAGGGSTVITTPTPTPVPTPILTSTPIPTLTANPYGNDKITSVNDVQINKPKGIYIRNGIIYVSYNKSSGSFSVPQGVIKLLNSTGSTIKNIQGSIGDNLPQDLSGIASDGGRIWALNRYSYGQSQNNIYSFLADGSGRMNAKIGSSSTETNFEDMAISTSTKTLYISSLGLNSIIKVSYLDNGSIDIGSQKTDFINSVSPTGLCTDNDGNIYITDSSKNPPLIAKYNSSGTKLLEFNSKGKKFDGPELSEIRDIGVDSQGRIYVIAKVNGNFTILRYDIGGNFIRQFGSDFQNPKYITVGDGVYVTDFDKNTIHLYSSGK